MPQSTFNSSCVKRTFEPSGLIFVSPCVLCDAVYDYVTHVSRSLHNQIRERKGDIFPETQVLKVLRHVNLGLHHLHSRRIVHLDIKPENILVRVGVYKIGDLGMATKVSILHNTVTGY